MLMQPSARKPVFFPPKFIGLSRSGACTPFFPECWLWPCIPPGLVFSWIHCWRLFSDRHLSAIIPEPGRGSILCASTSRSTPLGGRGWTQFKPSPMVGTQFGRTKSPDMGWGRSYQCNPNRVEPVPQSTLHGRRFLLEGFPAWPWPRRTLLGVFFEAEIQETWQETLWSPDLFHNAMSSGRLATQVQDAGQLEQQSTPK